HRSQHAGRRIHGRVDVAALGVWADNQGHGAVRVNVIGAVLGVVLHDKDGGVLPETALAYRLDDASQSQVVVGQRGRRRRQAHLGAARVIVGQTQNDQAGHRTFTLEAGQFGDKAIGALLIRVLEIEAAE